MNQQNRMIQYWETSKHEAFDLINDFLTATFISDSNIANLLIHSTLISNFQYLNNKYDIILLISKSLMHYIDLDTIIKFYNP